MRVRTLEAVTTLQRTLPQVSTSRALRTSVPRAVVELLGLNAGEKLRWVIDVSTGNVSVGKK